MGLISAVKRLNKTLLERPRLFIGLGLGVWLAYIIGLVVYADSTSPPEVVFTNRGSVQVLLFTDGYYVTDLSPNHPIKESLYDCRRGCLLEAVDEDGHVLFSSTLQDMKSAEANGVEIYPKMSGD
jgi:hypothetical protein